MTATQLDALPLISDFCPAMLAANHYAIVATLNRTHVLAIRDLFWGSTHEAESDEGRSILALCRAAPAQVAA